tara:strand:+ start:912 stop:1766 length:855 start_codon:yes stop_codon:yes gene_type:complete
MKKIGYEYTQFKIVQKNKIIKSLYKFFKKINRFDKRKYDNKKYFFFYNKNFYFLNNEYLINSYLKNENNTKILNDNQFIYEKNNSELFIDLIHYQKYDNFFDIGSAIGYFTLIASKEIKNIYSFECLKDVYLIQKSYIELFDLSNVHLQNNAVGDSSELIYEDYNGSFSGKSIKIDDFCKKNKIRNLDNSIFKIDIEGFEFEALKGMKETLKYKPKLIIEVHKFVIEKNNESLFDIIYYIFDHYSTIRIYLKNRSFLLLDKNKKNILNNKEFLRSKIFILETIS